MSGNSAMQARMDALAARLDQVEGQLAIANLKSRYSGLTDARYTRQGPKPLSEIEVIADRVAELFSEDAVWDGGSELGLCVGRDAIRERFRKPTLEWAWHFFVQPAIEVEGERARASWDVLALCTTAKGRAMWMIGVEHDEYARVEGDWLHTRMRLDAKLMAPHERGWGPTR